MMQGRIKKNWFLWWLCGLAIIIIAVIGSAGNPLEYIVWKIVLGVLFIYAGIIVATRKPVIIIDEEGIRVRSHLRPFASLELIEWSSINCFEHRLVENREDPDDDSFLVIEQKNKLESRRINIDVLNISPDQIMAEMRQYSLRFGVNEWKRFNPPGQ